MGSFMFLASALVSLDRRYFNMLYESLQQNHNELIRVHKACECVCVWKRKMKCVLGKALREQMFAE